MSERFIVMFSSEDRLWTNDCPITLEKGEILYDNDNEKYALRFIFKNVQPSNIHAVYLNIRCLDEENNEISTIYTHRYFDLTAHFNEEIGTDSLVYLDTSKAKNFVIIVEKIILEKDTVWTNDEKLKSLNDDELAELFKEYEVNASKKWSSIPIAKKMLEYTKRFVIKYMINIACILAAMTLGIFGATYFSIKTDNKEENETSNNNSNIKNRIEVNWKDSNIETYVRKELDISEGTIYEDDLENITTIKLRNKQINDISDLAYFPNLETVIMNNNKITDLAPLEGKPSLKNINFESNYIEDISSLKKMDNIESVNLSNNGIKNIKALASCPGIKELYLNNNLISDTSVFENMNSLEWLELADNDITDVTELGKLTHLTRLNLMNNPINNWTPVKDIKRVNGRKYKLNIQFNYTRDGSDFDGWTAIITSRNLMDLSREIYDENTISFPTAVLTSTVTTSLEMVEDNFRIFLHNSILFEQKELQVLRQVDIMDTCGEVNVIVDIKQGEKEIKTTISE